MKKLLTACCTYLVLVLSAQAAPSSDVKLPEQPEQNFKPAVVYFTQDISSKGLKTIYKKLSSANSPKVFSYAPDSFLYNADDSILANDETDAALLPDLPEEFTAAISSHSNLSSPRLKNHSIAKWHKFRFQPDLCYDPDLQPYATDALCKNQNWYPSEPIRENIRLLLHFKKQLHDPKTLVVLSKFKINGLNEMGGPAENMLAGNIPFNQDSGVFIPLTDWWVNRLADPQKETLFIKTFPRYRTIGKAYRANIPGDDGKRHNLGIVGSKNLSAVQQATLTLINQVNKEIIPSEINSSHQNWELESSSLINFLTERKIPEKIASTHNWELDNKAKKRIRELSKQRTNPDYTLIPLKK